jgi:hypothetical protein
LYTARSLDLDARIIVVLIITAIAAVIVSVIVLVTILRLGESDAHHTRRKPLQVEPPVAAASVADGLVESVAELVIQKLESAAHGHHFDVVQRYVTLCARARDTKGREVLIHTRSDAMFSQQTIQVV